MKAKIRVLLERLGEFPASPDALRQAPLYRVLHALAKGETSSEALTGSLAMSCGGAGTFR